MGREPRSMPPRYETHGAARTALERIYSGSRTIELLRDAAAVEAIRRAHGSFDALVRDLPSERRNCALMRSRWPGPCESWAQGWDEERLVKFDTSIPRRDEVEQWKGRLASARQRLRDLAAEAERAHQAADEARQRLQDAQERLDNDPAVGQMSRDALDAQRSSLPTARSCLIEYEQAEQRCRDLAALALDDSESTSRWQHFAMSTVLGILLGVLGFTSGREPSILAVGAALVALAAIAYALTTLLLSWLGKCSLVHQLDQHQLPPDSKHHYRVPDLFAVFRYKKPRDSSTH